MKRIHVGIDVDGVLRDLTPFAIALFKQDRRFEKYIDIVKPIEESSWEMSSLFPDTELGKEASNAFYKFVFDDPLSSYRIFKDAPICEYTGASRWNNCYDLLHQTLGENVTISFCTTQKNNWQKEATLMWLLYQKFKFDNLIIAHHHKDIFGLNFLLDDSPNNCIALNKVGSVGVLMNYPTNTNVKNIRRAYSIDGFVDFILNYKPDIFESLFQTSSFIGPNKR